MKKYLNKHKYLLTIKLTGVQHELANYMTSKGVTNYFNPIRFQILIPVIYQIF